MKVTVIGGSGHIGTYLVPMLVRAGHEVTSITRGLRAPYREDPCWEKVTALVLDRTAEDFNDKLAALGSDVVVDLLCFKLADLKKTVAALEKAHVGHYLFCSTLWSHGLAETLPADPDGEKEPIDEYGREKYACEKYLDEKYRKDGFPFTVVMPGHVSGAGWQIINFFGNVDPKVFEKTARGEKIYLPNFGMETLNHVHAEDVAGIFCAAIENRAAAMGQRFPAACDRAITLYGYARLAYRFFGKTPDIGFLPWKEWCEYIGDRSAWETTYDHIARSGFFGAAKAEKLLGFVPKHTIEDTILSALQSYVDRKVIDVD